MRFVAAWMVGVNVAIAGCSPAPAAPPAVPAEREQEQEPEQEPTPAETTVAPPETVTLPPEARRPPSTASYEEATATPESLDVHDDRAHLTDNVLTGPMRGVLSRCRVPSNAKVTIKTAVQNGRAIGVTVFVAFEHRKSTKRISRATARYEAKTSAKIVTCADRAVRALSWPPSSRRDSFTTVF